MHRETCLSDWNDLDALTALATLPGMRRRSLEALRQHFGGYAAALEAGPDAVAQVVSLPFPGAGEAVRAAGDLRAHLEVVQRTAERAGAAILTEAHPRWPSRLRGLLGARSESDAPAVLYVRGSLAALRRAFSVAVVGARRADGLARSQAAALGGTLASAGVVVVSGGAAGVDAAAHRGALEAGGTTVVVLGSGVDVPYPRAHRRLFEAVVEAGGALVSELPPGTPPKRWHFPARNRIVSGLSDAVTVVAAGPRSGALGTVRHGHAQGRVITAVPGDPRRTLSAGPNRLLVEGAAAILDGWDVVELLNGVYGPAQDRGRSAGALMRARRRAKEGATATGPELPLSHCAQRVLARLEAVPRRADDLAERAGLSGGEVARALAELELAGIAEQVAGGYVLSGSTVDG